MRDVVGMTQRLEDGILHVVFDRPGERVNLLSAETLEALGGLLLALAVDKPVLFIVEDLHWVDPTTTELLTRLLDQVPTARLLAILTARPSFTAI